MVSKTFVSLIAIIASVSAFEKIGEFNGKHYFVNKAGATHQGAKDWCFAMGRWNLVTVQSEEEFGYLKGRLPSHVSGNGYWTSATETETFKWENGLAVRPEYPIVIDDRACVAFQARSNASDIELASKNCDGLDGAVNFPLCEMINAKLV